MSQDRQASFKSYKLQVISYKFLIPIILIIILVIAAVFVAKNNKLKQTTADDVIIPDSTEVEVINADGKAPDARPLPADQSENNAVQQSPATVEDLGGGFNQPTSIETLLEGKDLEILK